MKKQDQTNIYNHAIDELNKLKESYKLPDQCGDLKDHAKVIIRNFGDESSRSHFHSLTNFYTHTPNEIRFIKTIKAIDVAIKDFESKRAMESLTQAQFNANYSPTPKRSSRFKLELYLLIYVLFIISIVLFQNFETVKGIRITPIQIIIIIGLPVVVVLGHFFLNKITDRWFAITLVILAIVIERLFNIFKILQ